MSKIPATLFAVAILSAWSVGVSADPPPSNNPGQPFEELEDKIDALAQGVGQKADALAQKIDDLAQQIDDLFDQLGLLQSSVDLIEAKLDVEIPMCPAVPNLRAAITKQEEQVDPPPGGGCAVFVRIVTLTNAPFKPLATGVMTPDHVSVLSGPTTSCNALINNQFRCNHEMMFQYPEGTSGSGAYELQLQYACDPASPECELCGTTTAVAFSLVTTACIEFEG